MADTDIAGVYRVFTDDSASPQIVFAAQMDPTESNLQQPPASDLGSILDGNEPEAAAETASANAKAQAAPTLVPGREFWYELTLAALLLGLFEMALAHRFSRSH